MRSSPSTNGRSCHGASRTAPWPIWPAGPESFWIAGANATRTGDLRAPTNRPQCSPWPAEGCEEAPPVRLLAQSLPDTTLPGPVGALVCVFDSMNHLLRPSDLRRTLRAAHRALLPGGLLLFDVTDERTFAGFFQGTWTVETETLHVTATAECSKDGMSGIIHFTVFDRKGGLWRRSDFDVRERNWPAADLRLALEAAGFVVLRARRVQPYPPEEADPPRPLWIARR